MNKVLSVLLIFVSICCSYAQEGYPKPADKDGLLFYIQHNRGKNAYIYSLNYSANHQINQDNPIQVVRQIFDNKGEIKPLTAIQKNFAYGIQTKKLTNTTFEASIVSLPSQKLYLSIPPKGKPYVETTVNGVKLQVHRIFIKQKDGTYGLGTKLDYILFYGSSKNKDTIQKLMID